MAARPATTHTLPPQRWVLAPVFPRCPWSRAAGCPACCWDGNGASGCPPQRTSAPMPNISAPAESRVAIEALPGQNPGPGPSPARSWASANKRYPELFLLCSRRALSQRTIPRQIQWAASRPRISHTIRPPNSAGSTTTRDDRNQLTLVLHDHLLLHGQSSPFRSAIHSITSSSTEAFSS